MITVSVVKFAACPISTSIVKKSVSAIFKKNGITSNSEVSVCLVDKKQMLNFATKYLGEKNKEAASHPVLSFVQSEIEGPFVFPPDEILHLGEIIVSFPFAIEEAKKKNKTITQAAVELAEHGALHLLGIHHN